MHIEKPYDTLVHSRESGDIFPQVDAEMERMDYTEDDDEEGGSRVSKNNQKANKLQIGIVGSRKVIKRSPASLLLSHFFQVAFSFLIRSKEIQYGSQAWDRISPRK